jgi:ABC-type polysaccharide/polyol phosphate export permease
VLSVVFSQLFGMDLAEYGVYLLTGLTFWNFLSAVTAQGCHCFQQGETYIRQYAAPLAIYPLRMMLGATFHFAMALLMVVPLSWFCHGLDHLPVMPVLLPMLAIMMVWGWSLCVVCGVANVFFADVKHILEIVLQVLFYATPVIYKRDMLRDRGMGWLADYNPLVPILELFRDPIVEGRLPSGDALALSAAVVAGTTVVAVLVLARVERKLIFHL